MVAVVVLLLLLLLLVGQIFNWYAPIDTWRAGFVAGAVQSLAAAPVDAIYTRLTVAEMLEGSHENLWVFGFNKLREIGLIGVFAGYGFSLVKESFGFAFYFLTFEIIKTQGYNLTYKLINYYKRLEQLIKSNLKKSSIGMMIKLMKNWKN